MRLTLVLILILLIVAEAGACTIVPPASQRIWWPLGIAGTLFLWANISIYVATDHCSRRVRVSAYVAYLIPIVALLAHTAIEFNTDGAVDCGFQTRNDIATIALVSLLAAAPGTVVAFARTVRREKT